MTVAPSHTLLHTHLGDDNPFELIPSRFGVMERWRALALQTGELGAMTVLRDHVKNDAISMIDEVAERERVVSERERAADKRDRVFNDAVAKFLDRAAPFVDRAEQAKADQEREPEKQAKPPGDAEQPAHGDPPGAPSHEPSGDPELHSIRAKQNPDAALPGDPTPPSVPLSYVHSRDQAEFPDPQIAHPPMQHPQPIAAGFDGE